VVAVWEPFALRGRDSLESIPLCLRQGLKSLFLRLETPLLQLRCNLNPLALHLLAFSLQLGLSLESLPLCLSLGLKSFLL